MSLGCATLSAGLLLSDAIWVKTAPASTKGNPQLCRQHVQTVQARTDTDLSHCTEVCFRCGGKQRTQSLGWVGDRAPECARDTMG